MVRLAGALFTAIAATAAPTSMKAVVALESASAGDFSKVEVKHHVVPSPSQGEVLIRVVASSVNPVDVLLLESVIPGAFVPNKVLGFDVAGVVEDVGPNCTRLQPGDAVWADLGNGLGGDSVQLGAWAEFAIAKESQVGLKPRSLSFQEASTLPLVGFTNYQALKKTGAPWHSRRGRDITVVVTSGSGGTGTAAVQMARAYGAARIITAASPSNAELLKQLGATEVIDHHQGTIWEALQNDTVDVVYDNYGAPGTADLAMASLRSDGVFVFLPGKGGNVSTNPKPGVTQVDAGIVDSSRHEDLDALAELAEAGQLVAVVSESYSLGNISEALSSSFAGHAVGKIGINVSSPPVAVLV